MQTVIDARLRLNNQVEWGNHACELFRITEEALLTLCPRTSTKQKTRVFTQY